MTDTQTLNASKVARVNGVAVNTSGEILSAEELRQRGCSELLRQAAQSAGLLDLRDTASPDGVISQAAASAIEALLEQNVSVPEPSEEACHRQYAAHETVYRTGERVRVRLRSSLGEHEITGEVLGNSFRTIHAAGAPGRLLREFGVWGDAGSYVLRQGACLWTMDGETAAGHIEGSTACAELAR